MYLAKYLYPLPYTPSVSIKMMVFDGSNCRRCTRGSLRPGGPKHSVDSEQLADLLLILCLSLFPLGVCPVCTQALHLDTFKFITLDVLWVCSTFVLPSIMNPSKYFLSVPCFIDPFINPSVSVGGAR